VRRVHASAYYAWIIEGLALFDALVVHGVEVIEVFPTASWTRWYGKRGSRTARPGLARDWQPSVWKACRPERTKTSETPSPLR
jgi:hypothetical protein